MCGAKPLVFADGITVFDRVGRVAFETNPSFFAPCAESLCLRIVNGKANTTPGFIRRTYFVRTVRNVTHRAFPAMRTRRIRRIDAVATFFAAPTIPVRASFGL